MTKFKSIAGSLSFSLWLIAAEGHAGELTVAWGDPAVQAAISSGAKISDAGAGFESAGGGPSDPPSLPVVGVDPIDFLSVLSQPASGFEAADRSAIETLSAPRLEVTVFEDKKGYSAEYVGVREGLSVYCSGDLDANEALDIEVKTTLTGESSEGISFESDPGLDGDSAPVATATQERFGVPYSCEIHCSSEDSRQYCENSIFAFNLIKRSKILDPGKER